ncbi:MAG: hypothetical protein M5U19_11510 [Microthrixaceae bacterium]|nr:hypothetical protein [Microthrixaceae bacterium]
MRESVEFLAASGLRVLFDAEHFFDGYKVDPAYSLSVLEAGAMALAGTGAMATPTAAACRTRCSASPPEFVSYFESFESASRQNDTRMYGIHLP